MSPPAASVAARRRSSSRRRRATVRRRRAAFALGAVGVEARAKRLDPALVAAVIYAESKFDPRPSAAGAEGLMQILPQTAEFLARRSGGFAFQVSDLATPE